MSERFTVEGVVWKIYPKTFGKDETFTIKLDGNKTWFRAGQNRYAGVAEAGNRITLEAEMLPDGESARVVKGSVKLAAAPAPAAAGAAPTASASYGNSGLQMRYQGALERAIHFVEVALANKAIKLPAKQAAVLGAIEAAVDHYTAQFYEDTNILGAVVREAESEDGEPEAVEDEGEEEEE